MSTTVLPAGPLAWLVETDDPVGYAEAVRSSGPSGEAVVEIVPAATTVLVEFADRHSRDAASAWLEAVEPVPAATAVAVAIVEIPVVYEGDDLDVVARATGLSVDQVIERHARPVYTSAFCGFAPGFAYLTGVDPGLRLPRRSTPRTRVPAGSVAIAAEYAAVYPWTSPGGWHILGWTDAPLWSTMRDQPALLVPGTRVRFVPHESP